MAWVSLGFGLVSVVSILLGVRESERFYGAWEGLLAAAGWALVVVTSGVIAAVLGWLSIRREEEGSEQRTVAVAGILLGAIPALLALFFLVLFTVT